MASRQRTVGTHVRILTAMMALAVLAVMALAGSAAAVTRPGKPAAKLPAGTITATKTTFAWGKAARATRYEVRVYQGSKQLLKKTAISKLTFKSAVALPTDVALTWKVRGQNSAGAGPWTSSKAFKIAVAPVLMVGDLYGGGRVAYLLTSSDKRFDPNVQHGLVAATADQSGTGMVWSISRTDPDPIAMATALGTGAANTAKIVAAQGTSTTYAARLAHDYAGGGYTDWYLPSKDELNKLYLSKDKLGGFAAATYWSSSQRDAMTVWIQFFNGGAQNYQYRNAGGAVRAVRSF